MNTLIVVMPMLVALVSALSGIFLISVAENRGTWEKLGPSLLLISLFNLSLGTIGYMYLTICNYEKYIS